MTPEEREAVALLHEAAVLLVTTDQPETWPKIYAFLSRCGAFLRAQGVDTDIGRTT